MKKRIAIALLILILLAGFGITVYGTVKAPDNLTLRWDVIASGGGPSSSTSYSLNATIGQPAAGPSEGDTTELGAGYWFGTLWEYLTEIFLPLIQR